MSFNLGWAIQRFIGWFPEPEPAGRLVPRTTGESSGPSLATPCAATVHPELPTMVAVVHGSENQLFGQLQDVGRGLPLSGLGLSPCV